MQYGACVTSTDKVRWSRPGNPFKGLDQGVFSTMMNRCHCMVAFVLCLLVAGCGGRPDTIQVVSGVDVPAEFARLHAMLPPEQAAGSQEAFDTLVMVIADECGGDESQIHVKMLERFNGKSVKAIIDEFQELDQVTVAKYAKVVAEKRARDKVEEEKRFNKRFNEELQATIKKQVDALDGLQNRGRQD